MYIVQPERQDLLSHCRVSGDVLGMVIAFEVDEAADNDVPGKPQCEEVDMLDISLTGKDLYPRRSGLEESGYK